MNRASFRRDESDHGVVAGGRPAREATFDRQVAKAGVVEQEEDLLGEIARGFARYPFDRLVSETFPLEEVNEAFGRAEWLAGKGAVGRVGVITAAGESRNAVRATR